MAAFFNFLTFKALVWLFNLEPLPAGIYALHLKSSDDSVSQRIKLAIVK